jgi:hypothetical protein
MPDAKIKQFFYDGSSRLDRCVTDEGDYIFPPPVLRRTAQQIREFVKLGRKQKEQQILLFQDYTIEKSNNVDYDETSHHITPESPPKETILSPPEPLNPFEDAASPAVSSAPSIPSSRCGGVTFEYISTMRYSQTRRDEVELGFIHTVREGWSTRQRFESPNNHGFTWPFCLPVVSCITAGSTSDIVWKVKENRPVDQLVSDFEKFAIKHRDCNGDEFVQPGKLCTAACESKKKRLFERFDSNLKLRTQPFQSNRPFTLDRTQSLSHERAIYWAQVARKYTKKIHYRDKVIRKLNEETAVEVPVNEYNDAIFHTKVADNVEEFLSKVADDSVIHCDTPKVFICHNITKKESLCELIPLLLAVEDQRSLQNLLYTVM